MNIIFHAAGSRFIGDFEAGPNGQTTFDNGPLGPAGPSSAVSDVFASIPAVELTPDLLSNDQQNIFNQIPTDETASSLLIPEQRAIPFGKSLEILGFNKNYFFVTFIKYQNRKPWILC